MRLSTNGHNIPAPWNTVPTKPILRTDTHVSTHLNQLEFWSLKPEPILQTGQPGITDASDTSLVDQDLPVDIYVYSTICT